eukprot:4751827-Prymnesium_polylepis.1
MVQESTLASAQRPVLPSTAMAGSIRELSVRAQAIAARTPTVVDGLERWAIAPAAFADRRLLFCRCRSLC